jgi:cupin fold WbuC family metalloprotein
MEDKRNLLEIGRGVFRLVGEESVVSAQSLARLKDVALEDEKRKARVLLHGDPQERLHEMVITHVHGHYIQPHINEASAKSFLVLEGQMVVLFFDDQGGIKKGYFLEELAAGGNFLLRIDRPVFHTLVVCSKTVTFVETVLGPHRGTRYAQFAPDPDAQGSENYFTWLEEESRRWRV